MIHTSSFHHAKYVWMTLRIIEIHLWIIAQKTSFHRSIDWFWNSFSFGIAAHLHHHSRLSYYPFPHFLRASIIVYSWCMNYLDGSSTDFKSLHANDFWAQPQSCWCQEEELTFNVDYSFRLYNELNQIQKWRTTLALN